MRTYGKSQTFVVRISNCQSNTRTQPSSTQNIRVEIDEKNEIEQQIGKYRRKVRNHRNWGIVLRMVIMALCIGIIGFVLSTVVGWCDTLKVDDTLSLALLVSIMLILVLLTTVVGYSMVKNRKHFNVALVRLDLLILRLRINKNGDMAAGTVERELQLVARILETKKS